MGLITALGKASNGDFTLPLGAIFIVLDFLGALLLIFALLVRLALLDVLMSATVMSPAWCWKWPSPSAVEKREGSQGEITMERRSLRKRLVTSP